MFGVHVLRAQQGENGLGCFLCVVERDFGEQVVDQMIVDDFVEKVSANETQASVDGSQSTLGVSPSFIRVVWHIWMSMVEICNCNCGDRDG